MWIMPLYKYVTEIEKQLSEIIVIANKQYLSKFACNILILYNNLLGRN